MSESSFYASPLTSAFLLMVTFPVTLFCFWVFQPKCQLQYAWMSVYTEQAACICISMARKVTCGILWFNCSSIEQKIVSVRFMIQLYSCTNSGLNIHDAMQSRLQELESIGLCTHYVGLCMHALERMCMCACMCMCTYLLIWIVKIK